MTEIKMKKINTVRGLRRLGQLEHLEINEGMHVVKYDPTPSRNGSSVCVFARPLQCQNEGTVIYFYPVTEKALSFVKGRPQAIINSAFTISADNEQYKHIYDGILREFPRIDVREVA